VGFVEVYLANRDWRVRAVADKTRDLMTQVDLGMSSLVRDLHDRGLLADTLVLWMGESGRSPRINNTGGRDHHSRAWSTVFFGGGIRPGQVIGTTDSTGTEVKERPISAVDFMATVCHSLGIDYKKEIAPPRAAPSGSWTRASASSRNCSEARFPGISRYPKRRASMGAMRLAFHAG
jgi:arylsulfatase A-like enzyme